MEPSAEDDVFASQTPPQVMPAVPISPQTLLLASLSAAVLLFACEDLISSFTRRRV
jgi:hypothetical protein